MKVRLAASMLALLLLLSGCGTSTRTHMKHNGVDPDIAHPLLNLRTASIRETHGSISGAFLFVAGGVGGSIDSTVKRYVGFVMAGQDDRVYELHYHADDIDYRLDRAAEAPSARLYVAQNSPSSWSNSSVTANLEDDAVVSHVLITLTPSDFSRDIAVLRYAGVGG